MLRRGWHASLHPVSWHLSFRSQQKWHSHWNQNKRCMPSTHTESILFLHHARRDLANGGQPSTSPKVGHHRTLRHSTVPREVCQSSLGEGVRRCWNWMKSKSSPRSPLTPQTFLSHMRSVDVTFLWPRERPSSWIVRKTRLSEWSAFKILKAPRGTLHDFVNIYVKFRFSTSSSSWRRIAFFQGLKVLLSIEYGDKVLEVLAIGFFFFCLSWEFWIPELLPSSRIHKKNSGSPNFFKFTDPREGFTIFFWISELPQVPACNDPKF